MMPGSSPPQPGRPLRVQLPLCVHGLAIRGREPGNASRFVAPIRFEAESDSVQGYDQAARAYFRITCRSYPFRRAPASGRSRIAARTR